MAFSIIASIKTCVMSRYKLINVDKEGFFPSVGKLLIIFTSLMSILGRVMSMIMYFGPSLGLFGLMNHWKREQTRVRPKSEGGPYEKGGNLTWHNITLLWDEVERNESLQQLKPTSYSIYTGLSIKWLYVMFVVGMVIHVIIVYLLKNYSSTHFKYMLGLLNCTEISWMYSFSETRPKSSRSCFILSRTCMWLICSETGTLGMAT